MHINATLLSIVKLFLASKAGLVGALVSYWLDDTYQWYVIINSLFFSRIGI